MLYDVLCEFMLAISFTFVNLYLQSLNGQTIFHGCCSLHIDFSKLRKLSVRYNNDKSRDFTNDNLPIDEDPNACYGGAAMYAGFEGPRIGGSLFGAYPDRIPRLCMYLSTPNINILCLVSVIY